MRKKEQAPIDHAISELFSDLNSLDPASEEYDAVADQLVKLSNVKNTPSPTRVSSDTLFTAIVAAATNLVGIALVLHHEQLNVVSSKAFALIRKST